MGQLFMANAIVIIGGADGPTSIYVTDKGSFLTASCAFLVILALVLSGLVLSLKKKKKAAAVLCAIILLAFLLITAFTVLAG